MYLFDETKEIESEVAASEFKEQAEDNSSCGAVTGCRCLCFVGNLKLQEYVERKLTVCKNIQNTQSRLLNKTKR